MMLRMTRSDSERLSYYLDNLDSVIELGFTTLLNRRRPRNIWLSHHFNIKIVKIIQSHGLRFVKLVLLDNTEEEVYLCSRMDDLLEEC